MVADGQRIQGVAHPRIGQCQCQSCQLAVGERTPPTKLLSAGEGVLDVASSLRIGPIRIELTALLDHPGQLGAALGIGGLDYCDKLGTTGVQAATVQHRGRRDRRRRGVLDHTRAATSICAVPPAAGSDLVDHVHGEQLDIPRGEFDGQLVCEVAVLLGAHLARGALVIDDHRDRDLGSGCGGHLREVTQRVNGLLAAEISTHDGAHLSVRGGYEHQRFLGHEAKDSRERSNQNAGPVERGIGAMCF